MKLNLRSKLANIIENCILIKYKKQLPRMIKVMRKKDKIKVLFVVAESSKWKTENLYKEMTIHPRFTPIIGITLKTDDKPSESARKILQLIDYLKLNGYKYQELIGENFIKDSIRPDIIIYQEPYSGTILRGLNYLHNLNSIFISITYGFHSVLLPFNHNIGYKKFAWFDCYENESTARDAIEYTKRKRKNILVTGLPMSESFLKYYSKKYVWKDLGHRKKIIWAPHHSIGFDYETITYGNFLTIADKMIELSEKYKDSIQWAFKPHPLLKSKLDIVWGRDKTEKYYSYWKNSVHTQLEEGEYVDLFMQSDGMIHDCDTFTIEYLYANKPVMYLYNGANHNENLNKFAKKALSVHYSGYNADDIEKFIIDIISGNDIFYKIRNNFYNQELNIDYGKYASKNIISLILGIKTK